MKRLALVVLLAAICFSVAAGAPHVVKSGTVHACGNGNDC